MTTNYYLRACYRAKNSEMMFSDGSSHERMARMEYEIKVDHRWNFKIDSYRILCDVALLFQLALPDAKAPSSLFVFGKHCPRT